MRLKKYVFREKLFDGKAFREVELKLAWYDEC